MDGGHRETVAAEPPARRRRHRFSSRVVAPLAMLTDLLCLIIAAPIALILYSLTFGSRLDYEVHLAAATISAVCFFLLRISRDSYNRPLGRAQDADQGVVFDYFIAALLTVALVWQFGLADKVSRALIAFYAVGAIILLFLSRYALRKMISLLAQHGHIAQRVVLFGADRDIADRAIRMLELERLPHLQIVGLADDRATRISTGKLKIPMIGGFQEVEAMAQRGEIDHVLIAVADINQARLDEIVESLSAVSVDVSLIPREALVLSSSYKVSFIGSAPVLSIWERPVRDIDVIVKNLEDKLLAAVALVLLSPVLLLTAAAIKLTSPGPILFRQRRFGFNNLEIWVLKFRSMHVDKQDVSGAARTRRADGRVTPVGRVIRRLSIDELPQLLNVLRGDMSLVGPRPHATAMKVGDRYYFEAVRGYASRHRVKPGITGLAQIRGLRGEIDSVEKAKKRVDYDRFYIDNWSLMLDLRIMLETVVKVVWDKNAY